MDEIKKEIKEGFEEALKKGLLEVTGHNENGETLYRLTKKGEEYVEAMPFCKAIKEEADNTNRSYS